MSSCCFCLSNMTSNHKCVTLACDHTFHQSCMNKYIRHISVKQKQFSCPFCRREGWMEKLMMNNECIYIDQDGVISM